MTELAIRKPNRMVPLNGYDWCAKVEVMPAVARCFWISSKTFGNWSFDFDFSCLKFSICVAFCCCAILIFSSNRLDERTRNFDFIRLVAPTWKFRLNFDHFEVCHRTRGKLKWVFMKHDYMYYIVMQYKLHSAARFVCTYYWCQFLEFHEKLGERVFLGMAIIHHRRWICPFINRGLKLEQVANYISNSTRAFNLRRTRIRS